MKRSRVAALGCLCAVSVSVQAFGQSLTILGGTAPQRGWTGAYVARSDPAGEQIDQFNWSFTWSGGQNTWQDNDTNDDDMSVWSGTMVIGGTLTCSAVINGQNCSKSITISPAARSWPTPITCDQDNDSGYGNVPTTGATLSQNRDRDSDETDAIFVPRNGSSDFSSARTLSQVPSGPCAGWYYVSSSTLKCQRETVINRYIKSGGPVPSGAAENFYDRNDADCIDAVSFVLALEHHEYRGTPATALSFEGHQGRIEYTIFSDDHDAKQHIEALTSRSLSALSDLVNSTISTDESAIKAFGLGESYMQTYGPNWGWDTGSLGSGMHKRWDGTSDWTPSCNNGPSDF